MRTRTAALLVTAALFTGAGAAVVAPAVAATEEAGSVSDRTTRRLDAIKDALTGLVSKGTLTQDQADAVADTLADADLGGPGGFGGHGRGGAGHLAPDAVAEVIGVTVDELRAAREAGKTLAQLAQENGVSRDDLVAGLVAAAKEQLAADVEAGRLTQEKADELEAGLEARIGERVDQVGGPGRGFRGGHGDGDGPGDRDGDGGTPDSSSSPSTSPSTSPSAAATS